MFLIRKEKACIAHIWTGFDTVCRMHSTGGMSKKRYHVVDQSDLPICAMCGNKKAIYPKKDTQKSKYSKNDKRLLESAMEDALKPRFKDDRYARAVGPKIQFELKK